MNNFCLTNHFIWQSFPRSCRCGDDGRQVCADGEWGPPSAQAEILNSCRCTKLESKDQRYQDKQYIHFDLTKFHLPPCLTTCAAYSRLAVVLTSSYWPGTVLSLVVVIISCPHHLPVSGSPQCWPCCSCSWWPCWSPHPWASPPALASPAIAQNHSLAMSVMWSVMWGGTMCPFVRLE